MRRWRATGQTKRKKKEERHTAKTQSLALKKKSATKSQQRQPFYEHTFFRNTRDNRLKLAY
jgi:hypothetical protein